jgi:electron transfer flavoprotein beta subunit
MRILVPVKQVVLPGEYVALDADGSVRSEGFHRELNEWDLFSLEAALRLRESSQEGEVVAATVGDDRAEEVLFSCLAMGADRAVRAWDPQLEGADPLAVATVLAAVAGKQAPDLILCGAQSADGAHAASGVALAGLLDLAHVAVVDAIEREGGRLTVQRELEGGAVEVLRVSLPALLTVQTQINEPRRPTLRAIKQAREKPLEILDLPDLGIEPDAVLDAAGSRTVRLAERERGDGARMLAGSPGEIAASIAALVRGGTGA